MLCVPHEAPDKCELINLHDTLHIPGLSPVHIANTVPCHLPGVIQSTHISIGRGIRRWRPTGGLQAKSLASSQEQLLYRNVRKHVTSHRSTTACNFGTLFGHEGDS